MTSMISKYTPSVPITTTQLGDFGLAQLVLPFEKLKKVYGTIAYMSI